MTRIAKKRILIYLAVLIAALSFVLVFHVAFAFLDENNNGIINSAGISSDVVDELKFIPGDALSIAATSKTLPELGNNLSVTSKPQVSLKANGTTNEASYPYYIYLNLKNNGFIYSTVENTPEVILSVIDPEGREVTDIPNLSYSTTYGVDGFDVTTYEGLIPIANAYMISSNSSDTATIQDWTITLTYINLTTDQSPNYGKSINTEVIMSKEAL